jgi:lysophospholipase L1-like esterase
MRKIKLIILIVILFLGLELYLKYTKPSPYLYDPELGWSVKKNFRHKYKEKDFYGDRYDSLFETNDLGARSFIWKSYLNKSNQPLKILVVGDSFTMDPYVSNKEMWFSVLANKIGNNLGRDVEVMAFGGGAYGTLQQLLLLRRNKQVIDNFSPNMFVFQFCSNDFSNNSFAIEKANFSLSQYMRRPYLVNDQIYYYNGFFSYFFQKNILTRDSRIFAKAIFLYEFFVKKYYPFNNNLIDSYVINESNIITQKLLTKIRNLYPNTESYIFSCSNDQSELNKNWKVLAKKSKFVVLNASSDFIDKASSDNKKIFYKDGGHLNKLGNLYWGELIYEEITKKKFKF